jgi:hypothetical protein
VRNQRCYFEATSAGLRDAPYEFAGEAGATGGGADPVCVAQDGDLMFDG